MYRCDVAQDAYAEPGFLYPELSRVPPSSSLADRRATAAAIFTDPRNGRLPRTRRQSALAAPPRTRHRLQPRRDGRQTLESRHCSTPWPATSSSSATTSSTVIGSILTSRAYQMPAVARTGEVQARGYVFAGPEVRRLSAEQFADASRIDHRRVERLSAARRSRGGGGRGGPAMSDPSTVGVYGRDWRAASSDLTRALGRPIRDQIISVAPGRGDDAAGAGAGERRDAHALVLARRAAHARRAAAGVAEPVQQDRWPAAMRAQASSISRCRARRSSG